jgi:hypothetical protein
MNVVEENHHITNRTYTKEEHRCIKCGKKLTSFIAYIPSMGEACMDCYIEAAKKSEVNTSP